MREERRAMATNRSEFRGKHQKAGKHAKTKSQQIMLSEQLIERSEKFAVTAMAVIGEGNMHTISEINRKGRRVKDTETLRKQIADEMAKASKLRRTPLTADSLKILASNTKLTNDAKYVYEPMLVTGRLKMKKMMVQKFWQDLNPTKDYKKTFVVALNSFVHMRSHMCWMEPKGLAAVTSWAKANKLIVSHMKWMQDSIIAHIMGFVGDMEVGCKSRAMVEHDVLWFFIRVAGPAGSDERVAPVEQTLVDSCCSVKAHYTFTKNRKINVLGRNGVVDDGFDDIMHDDESDTPDDEDLMGLE